MILQLVGAIPSCGDWQLCDNFVCVQTFPRSCLSALPTWVSSLKIKSFTRLIDSCLLPQNKRSSDHWPIDWNSSTSPDMCRKKRQVVFYLRLQIGGLIVCLGLGANPSKIPGTSSPQEFRFAEKEGNGIFWARRKSNPWCLGISAEQVVIHDDAGMMSFKTLVGVTESLIDFVIHSHRTHQFVRSRRYEVSMLQARSPM